jgi:hypothetical protein
MAAIFTREGNLFRATEAAGGPWSPDMLQGSATTALMVRENAGCRLLRRRDDRHHIACDLGSLPSRTSA